METTNDFSSIMETNPAIKPLMDVVDSIMALSDDNLNDKTLESMKGMIAGAITPTLRQEMINTTIEDFRNQGYSRASMKQNIATCKNAMEDFINELQPSANKRELLNSVFKIFYDVFEDVEQKYLAYDIEVEFALEGNAQLPTYAHETDAAADIYALETVTVAAGSRGNKIRTGFRMGLPEGWVAYIVPRSSIGVKTPLRLSNNVGVIDSDYRGEVCVLYDNISDSDYTITAGDRIAQLIVVPCYHFKPRVVDEPSETERGAGGFGSTGK